MSNTELKIGKTSVKIVDGYYSLSDVISDYNKRYSKNRSHADFKRLDYLKQACQILNQFHKCRTYNENSILQYHKNPDTGKANLFGHVLVFAKYLVWCFPDKNLHAKNELYKFMASYSHGPVYKYLGWLSRKYEYIDDGKGFDPLMMFRDFYLIYKFQDPKYEFEDLENAIKMNKSMIEAGIDFKSRYIVITKFFNK